ncbi:hypothetical protein TNCV_1551291 [Trichonephila clavipes]|nr:hypothetical protein TNCV_1551291 [Trichonephila clavipes]
MNTECSSRNCLKHSEDLQDYFDNSGMFPQDNETPILEKGKDCFAARCYPTQILESGGNPGNFFSPNKLNAAEFLFILINVSYHWVLLVANLSPKKLNLYDPLGFGTEANMSSSWLGGVIYS